MKAKLPDRLFSSLAVFRLVDVALKATFSSPRLATK